MSQSLAVLEAAFNAGTTLSLTEIPAALFNINDMFGPVLVRGSEKPSAGFAIQQIIFYGIIFLFMEVFGRLCVQLTMVCGKAVFDRGNKGFQYRRIGQYPRETQVPTMVWVCFLIGPALPIFLLNSKGWEHASATIDYESEFINFLGFTDTVCEPPLRITTRGLRGDEAKCS